MRMTIAALAVALLSTTAHADATWKSGSRNTGRMSATGFADWRETKLGVVTGWIDYRNGWSGMYAYASGSNPRTLKKRSTNMTFGHGLFPSSGSNLADCAAGQYDDEQREVARRLALNGAGSAEIRLGWEATGDWFAWTAVGKPASQWKDCFTHVAKAMLLMAPDLRIAWSMAKKGRIDPRTIYPDDDSFITNIGVSHYDDAEARVGWEVTKAGAPWGLRSWLDFAKKHGKGFIIGEWGVGRRGDNPAYIQAMYDFFKEAGPALAHEAYFNSGKYELYPVGPNPNSSQLYRDLF